MAIRLTLVCAAPAAGVRPGTFPDDEPADLAGFAPASGAITRLLTAPELRARQTAGVIGAATVETALGECDYGTWRGRDLGEIGGVDAAGAAAWIADPAAAPHGGESIAVLIERVGGWLDRFDAAGHTMAVTHPAVIRAAVVHVLGAPATAFWRIDIEPLSVTDLRRHAGRWTLRSVGRA
jgi:broad specificity phosphatase PhoE